MINPNDILSMEPAYQYITYSYKDGISNALKIVAIASVFALINVIISLIIGIRKKDCLAIFVVNVMVKTVTRLLFQILENLQYFYTSVNIILPFLATLIIEGIIYKKVLKYKKDSGMTISIICNTGMVVSIILMMEIFWNWI